MIIVVTFLAFICVGFRDSLLGVAWPTLKNVYGVSNASLGIVIIVIYLFMTIASKAILKLNKKYSTLQLLILFSILIMISLLGYGISNYFWLFIIFTAVFGFSSGIIDSLLNSYISKYHGSRFLNWLQCFYSLGATISPAIFTLGLRQGRWQMGFYLLAGFELIIIIIIILTRKYWNSALPVESINGGNIKKIVNKINKNRLLIAFLGMLIYCSFDATISQYGSQYLIDVKGITNTISGFTMSLLFMGVTIGRVVMGIWANKISNKTAINLGKVLILFSIIMMLFIKNYSLLNIVFVLLGIGISPIYPMTIQYTADIFGINNNSYVVSKLLTAGYIGCSIIPLGLGVLFQYYGFIWFYPIILVLFVLYHLLNTFFDCSLKKKVID